MTGSLDLSRGKPNKGKDRIMKARIWSCSPLCSPRVWLVAGCGGDDDEAADTGSGPRGDSQELDNVTLQLKWVTQAQFAGYYAALEDGLLRGRRAST